jgi:phage shock protein C
MKKYTRSLSNRYFAGVCGGLENLTGIDAIVWRLIFVFAPSSLLVYLIMWAFTKNEGE